MNQEKKEKTFCYKLKVLFANMYRTINVPVPTHWNMTLFDIGM